MEFEWDPEKAARNIVQHGVSFEEASTAFGDPLSITIADPRHSVWRGEIRPVRPQRSRPTGRYRPHRPRRDARIISARLATRHERKQYES